MKKALVTGATGFVGGFMCEELLEQGDYEVTAIVRNVEKAQALKEKGVILIEGDFSDLEALKKACEGKDVIFHIGAAYREAKHGDDLFWKVNVEGTKNIFETALACGVRKIVHCSTIGVTSTIENPPGDENHPYCPADAYQESKVEGEKLALQFTKDHEIDITVIRPAMIWGPKDTRFLKMFKGVFKGFFPMIGGGGNLCHWILVTDLVRAFRLASEAPGTRGEVFIIAGDKPITLKETCTRIARSMGLPSKFPYLPVWPFQLAGIIVETICRPFKIEPPIHRRRADFFIKNRAFSTQKAKKILGFTPAMSIENEIDFVTRWYLSSGLL
jgi:nucleoside-diphosphate-sugar epimerase